MTHELRQPLSLIIGYAELLARPDLPAATYANVRATNRLWPSSNGTPAPSTSFGFFG